MLRCYGKSFNRGTNHVIMVKQTVFVHQLLKHMGFKNCASDSWEFQSKHFNMGLLWSFGSLVFLSFCLFVFLSFCYDNYDHHCAQWSSQVMKAQVFMAVVTFNGKSLNTNEVDSTLGICWLFKKLQQYIYKILIWWTVCHCFRYVSDECFFQRFYSGPVFGGLPHLIENH